MAIPNNSFYNIYKGTRVETDPALQRAMFGRLGGAAPRIQTAQPINPQQGQGIVQLASLGNVVPPAVQTTEPIEATAGTDEPESKPEKSFFEHIFASDQQSASAVATEPGELFLEAEKWFDSLDTKQETAVYERWGKSGADVEWPEFIVKEYKERGTPEDREVPEDRGAVEAGEESSRNDAAIKLASDQVIPKVTEAAEEEGGLDSQIQSAKSESKTALDNLRNADEGTLENLLAAVPGVDPNKTMSDYNKDAKELLGISQDEDDVPDWAAPMFLFGLNLMKAPQTAKTGQQGLGGLLGDIGEAGTVAFKEFGAQRARKQKERAAVATLATSLRTADVKAQGEAFRRVMEGKKFKASVLNNIVKGTEGKLGKLLTERKEKNLVKHRTDVATALAAYRKANLDHSKQQTENTAARLENSRARLEIAERKAANDLLTSVNTQIEKATGPIVRSMGKDTYRIAQFLEVFTKKRNELLSGEEKEGKTPEEINQLLFEKMTVPGAPAIIVSAAMQEVGMRPTIKLDKVKIAGTEYTVDTFGLQSWIKDQNKDKHKDAPKLSYLGAVQDAITNPESGAWKFILGRPEQKLIDETQTIGGITYKVTIDDAKRKAWLAANPQQENENPAAYAARVRGASSGWTYRGEGYRQDAPKKKEFSFQDKTGTKRSLFFNEEDFLIDSKRDNTLSLQEMLNNPTDPKYKKYFYGEIKDYSNLGGSITTETIYEGGKKQKIILDKAALAAGVADGSLDPMSTTFFGDLINNGVAKRIGGAIDVGKNETVSIVNSDGEIIQITAKNANGLYSSFASKKDKANFNAQKIATLNLNRSLHEIYGVLRDGNAISATSKASDFLGALGSLGQQLKTRLGYSLNPDAELGKFISGMKSTNIDNKDGQADVRKAFKYFLEGPDHGWGGIVIEDKAQRRRIKSIFISLAFDLASAREGGKLTDNDVRNALETLGWDGTSWTQSPQTVLSGMMTAAQTANENFYTNAVNRMSDEEKDKLKAKIKAGEVGFIEQLLREQMDVRGDQDAGVMRLLRKNNPDAKLRFDHFLSSEENRNRVSGGKIKPKLDPEKVFITENEFSEGNLGAFTPKINKATLPRKYELIWPKLKLNGLPDTSREIASTLAKIADNSGGTISRELAVEFGKYLRENGYLKTQGGQ